MEISNKVRLSLKIKKTHELRKNRLLRIKSFDVTYINFIYTTAAVYQPKFNISHDTTSAITRVIRQSNKIDRKRQHIYREENENNMAAQLTERSVFC